MLSAASGPRGESRGGRLPCGGPARPFRHHGVIRAADGRECPQAVPAAQAGPLGNDGLVAGRLHLDGLQRRADSSHIAPALRLRAVDVGGNDVAVCERTESLHNTVVSARKCRSASVSSIRAWSNRQHGGYGGEGPSHNPSRGQSRC